MPKFNPERAATILSEAALLGDRPTAEKWNVSVRTIEGWRARMEQDSAFAAYFQKKLQRLEGSWVEEVDRCILKLLDFLKRAADAADPASPEAVEAIAAAMKTISQCGQMKRVIDLRLKGVSTPEIPDF